MQTQISQSSKATVYSPPTLNQLEQEANRLYQFYVIPNGAAMVIGSSPKPLSRMEENLWLNFARKNLYKTFLQAQKERQ